MPARLDQTLRPTRIATGLGALAVTAVLTASGVVPVPVGPGPAGSPAPSLRPAAASAGCRIAPRFTPKRTRFGLSVSTVGRTFHQALRRHRAVFGGQPVIRVYDGLPSRHAWRIRTPALTRHTAVVTSFKLPPAQVIAGRYDRQLRHFFRAAPARHKVFWVYWHEPEDEVRGGRFTAAQYRAAYRHIAVLAGSLCRKNLFPTLVLTGWTADPAAPGSWRDYYPGRRYVSVLAWDPYNTVHTAPTRYKRPAEMFGTVRRVSRAAHKAWGIAETGSDLVAGDDGSGRAAWLSSLGRYANRHHAAFVVYFDSTDKTSDVDFRLTDRPSIRAWRQLMHP